MSLAEAKAKLRCLFPGRTICVQVDVWIRHNGTEYAKYTVSVQPGENKACDQWTGKNLAEAVHRAQESLVMKIDVPATEADVEAHFAEALQPLGAAIVE